jgi:predicted ArsR family transcriptional regulator
VPRVVAESAGHSTLNPQLSTFPHPLNQRLLQTVGRSARLKVLNEIKRTQGIAVGEIAEKLGMSYMGVKDLCNDLARRGLLDTWREPQSRGRPKMLYRLTPRAHELFPTASNSATIAVLEAAQKLYGPTAPEKLLMILFQRKAEEYSAKLKGDTLAERVKSLVRLRDLEGSMSECETDADGALRIVEHHSPILDLLQAFPIVARLEGEMFQRILQAPVRREEETVSGLYCCTLHVGRGR